MKTVFSPRHAGHSGNVELDTNEIVPAYEKPSRAEFIRARIEAVGLGPIVEPQAHGLETARKVHDPAYLEFLESVYPEWLAAGRSGTAMPYVWPTRALRADVVPTSIEGKIGFYAFDAGATFVAGTWDAVRSSHDSALSAASLVESGEPATMQAQILPAAIASSTMQRWPPSGSSIKEQSAFRSSMSIITTATAPRKSSTAAATCRS